MVTRRDMLASAKVHRLQLGRSSKFGFRPNSAECPFPGECAGANYQSEAAHRYPRVPAALVTALGLLRIPEVIGSNAAPRCAVAEQSQSVHSAH